ncbi:pentapeptide repeat-containing protein [Streptomyces cellulosae]
MRPEAPLPRPSARAGGDLTDDERAEHAARLRGLLYLACPDAPAGALEYTAEAITLCAEEPPAEAVPEASHLGRPRQPFRTDPLNLCGVDLRGANLTGADLSHADMYGADLSGADLSGANLSHANLTGAGLTHAILSGGDLTDAVLTGAELTEAVLTGAVLAGVTDLRVPE